MRAPPPACVLCVGGLAWRLFQAALHGLAALALVAGAAPLLGYEQGAWPAALVCGAVAAAAGWAYAAAAPAVQLRWTGAQWCLNADQSAPLPPPVLMVDLGHWMLLRVAPPAAPRRWLAVSRRTAGAEWLALRAAVYAAAPGAAARPGADLAAL